MGLGLHTHVVCGITDGRDVGRDFKSHQTLNAVLCDSVQHLAPALDMKNHKQTILEVAPEKCMGTLLHRLHVLYYMCHIFSICSVLELTRMN